ncbi:hypothetical protein Tco_0844228 [Tanacetum coccineum]
MYPPVAWVALLTEVRISGLLQRQKRKAISWRQWAAGAENNSADKTWNLSLKEITDKKGPFPIRFELRDKQTLMPLGDHAAYWSSYIGEVIRGVPLYYPSWLKVPKERKAALITDIGFDSEPQHMEFPPGQRSTADTPAAIDKKAYNTNKAAFKAHHWVIDRDLLCGEDQADTILDIKFGKSPSEFDHPIENPSKINLLDISDDEDPLPHDLADSDVEDLINDDDGVEKIYSSEEED